jgi:hypothetical protein
LGQISAQLVIVYFGQLMENYRNSPHFGATFSIGWGFAIILTKTGWAMLFWATFSQTHLVTLLGGFEVLC